MNSLFNSVSLQPLNSGSLMQWTLYILQILFSAFTGWLAIWITIKICFWPQKPISVFGFKFQGLLLKYQPVLAQQLGELISRELLSFSTLQQKVTDPASFEKLKPEIEFHIDHFLREKLKESFPMLSMFIGDKTINQLKSAFLMELESLFPVIMKSYLANLEKDTNPAKLITEKIAAYPVLEPGVLLNKTSKKLFIRLQLAGVIIGALLGLLQVLLILLIYR